MQFHPVRLVRYYFFRLIRLRGDPHSLAGGIGFGLFVGILPLFPVQTIILIPLALLLRTNTLAAIFAATAASNPLTFLPQYYYTWKVGNMILPGRVSWEHLQEVMLILDQGTFLEGISTLTHLGFKSLSVILIGGTIIGLPIAVVGYFIALYFFKTLHRKRMARHKLD